jgi:hypothetical protein
MKFFAPFNQQPGENLLINGNFDIWQRATGPLIDNADHAHIFDLADRWSRTVTANGMAMPTVTQGRATFTTGVLDLSHFFYEIITNGFGVGIGVNSVHYISQKIENGVFRFCGLGKNVTLSYYTNNASATAYGVGLIINYGAGGSATEYIPIGVFQSLNLNKHIHTATMNTLAGKTVGAGNYIEVVFGVMWGATIGALLFGATAERYYPNNAEFRLAQVKLEQGSICTPFANTDEDSEFTKCLRYLRRFNAAGIIYQHIANGQCTSATSARYTIPVLPMYRIPTVTQTGNLMTLSAAGGATALTVLSAADPSRSSTSNIALIATVAAGLVAGDATILQANNDVTGDVWMDAEIP